MKVLAQEATFMQEKFKEIKRRINDAAFIKEKIHSARKTTRNISQYWKDQNPAKYADWLNICVCADKLLEKYDAMSCANISKCNDMEMNIESEVNVVRGMHHKIIQPQQ